MMHTSFARRLTLGILLGLIALVGTCLLAGFIRYQRNISYMDTVATSLGLTRADRMRAPYRKCFDIGHRCYVVGHYRTTLSYQQVMDTLERQGMTVRRGGAFSGDSFMMLLTGTNDRNDLAHEMRRLTINGVPYDGGISPGITGDGLLATQPSAPDMNVGLYDRPDPSRRIAYDGIPLDTNILEIKVLEYRVNP